MHFANFILRISRLTLVLPTLASAILGLFFLFLFSKLTWLVRLLAPFTPGRYFRMLRAHYKTQQILLLVAEFILS